MVNEDQNPIVALHLFMNKWHATPVYECLSKFGKPHKPSYRYRCSAMAAEFVATGRTKDDARRVVANMILQQIALRGYQVPGELSTIKAIYELMDEAGLPTQSFVVLVSELCKQFRLDQVEYLEVVDPAVGNPTYTIKARIGRVVRVGTGPTRRVAQQLAAEQMYRHLCTKLKPSKSFNEEEVMYKAYTKAAAPKSDDDKPEDQRRMEAEEKAEVTRKMNKKKTRAAIVLEQTVAMELDDSEDPKPSNTVPDEQGTAGKGTAGKGKAAKGVAAKSARENLVDALRAAAEDIAAEGAAAECIATDGAAADDDGAEGAAALNIEEEEHEIAMGVISRIMHNLGI